MKTYRAFLTPFLAIALIQGCATAPEETAAPAQPQTVQGLLQAASETDDAAQRLSWELEAAERLARKDDPATALRIIREIEPEQLSESQQDRYLGLIVRISAATDDIELGASVAGRLERDLAQRVETEDQSRTALDQAELHRNLNAPLKGAQVLISNHSLLDDEQQKDAINRTWQLLRESAHDELEEASLQATVSDEQGWLELALSMRETERDTLEAQSGTIRRWQQNWPDHPATVTPPRELELLASLPDQRPEHLALALPLSGPLAGPGRAVREGFMAAFYQDTNGNHPIELTIHDTGQDQFRQVYAELLETNPDLVIGPLDRDELSRLTDQPALPIPVLALNYLDRREKAPEQLYQFGLAGEDEVRQVANRLEAEGHRNALVFAPSGSWGNRMISAFEQAHEDQGGRMVRAARFDRGENLNQVVADGFAINESRRRANALMRLTGTSMQYEPRRRQDVDAIVMLASPAQARQFKPLFAFYYGGRLPVYGTSLLYASTPDPSRDSDLDGTRFTDLPWVLEPNETLRPLLRQLFPALAERYDRLFALGVDSYQLASRLPLLEEVSDAWISGHTGRLTMDEQGALEREQLWARFESGVPVIMTPPEDAPRDATPSLPGVMETQ